MLYSELYKNKNKLSGEEQNNQDVMIEGQLVKFVRMNSLTCTPLYNPCIPPYIPLYSSSEVGYQAFFITPLVEILAKIV